MLTTRRRAGSGAESAVAVTVAEKVPHAPEPVEAFTVQPLPIPPEVAAFLEQVSDEDYAEVLRAAAFGNRIPVPTEPLELCGGTQVTDPNRFVMLALERAQKIKGTPSTTRMQEQKAREALMRISCDSDQVAAWWFAQVGEEVFCAE